jgi:hypothetical protein
VVFDGFGGLLIDNQKTHQIEVWAQLCLCAEDCARVADFFVTEFRIKPNRIIRSMHVTVYHSRRPMQGVSGSSEAVEVTLPASETRFMVLAPGGENPRYYLDPRKLKVGIRIHKRSHAYATILRFRQRLVQYETNRVLGSRDPSTDKKSAFGARYYQPHMAILRRPGAQIDRDLTQIGVPFRAALGDLTFDRFRIDVVPRASFVQPSSQSGDAAYDISTTAGDVFDASESLR